MWEDNDNRKEKNRIIIAHINMTYCLDLDSDWDMLQHHAENPSSSLLKEMKNHVIIMTAQVQNHTNP